MNPHPDGVSRTKHVSTDGDSLFGQLADEYLSRCERGESPNIDELAARHPEIADEVRRVLTTLAVLDDPGPHVADDDRPYLSAPLGEFSLVRRIGHGGMGVVYEAIQSSLGRRVALKVLPLAAILDPRQLARFQNEARAAALLEHPHIVPIYGVGCERGVHYIAMRLIDGPSLAELLVDLKGGKSGPTAVRSRIASAHTVETTDVARDTTHCEPGSAAWFHRVAQWGIEVAEALHYAHERGIIHRDIKPGNLLVEPSGQVWISDFGLARVEGGADLTTTGELLGTLRYMSPEQVSGDRASVDRRTDIYGLGLTLYEISTLHPVVGSDSRAEALREIVAVDPPSPRQFVRRFPVDFETILLKALAKDPADRFATAADFAADLRRWLNQHPIAARRPSTAQRLAIWFRRRRAIVLPVGVMSLATVVTLAAIVGWWLHNRATQQGAMDSLKSESVNAHRDLGEAMTNSGKLELALAAIRRTIDLEPHVAHHHYNLGRVLQQYERIDEAIPCFRRAIEIDPRHPRAHYNLGVAWQQKGQWEEAATQFRIAIECQPDYFYPHFGLGSYYVSQRRFDEAIECFRQAVALEPKFAQGHVELGHSLLHRSRFAEALAAYQVGHDLVVAQPEVSLPTEEYVATATRYVKLDAKLLSLLAGDERPRDARETLDFAAICFHKERFEDSVRLYAQAFASDSSLESGGAEFSNAFEASCAAVMAADRLHNVGSTQSSKRASDMLDLAHRWLTRELAHRQTQLQSDAPAHRRWAAEALHRCQDDACLASLRDATRLERLPHAEQERWRTFWQQVAELVGVADYSGSL
jgi:serine/threonine protein kinase/Flp pilus assembly protein TadD